MNRRKFIESSAIALITAHIAGCKEISEVTHIMRPIMSPMHIMKSPGRAMMKYYPILEKL